MAKIGIIPSKNCCKNGNNVKDLFNYDWVLEQLSKDEDIEGIDRIGFTDDGYEVFIVTDDDRLCNIPHFHYRKKEKGKPCEFHTCIRFDNAKYFYHIGNEDVLNDKQKEELINFFKLEHKTIRLNLTNWEVLIMSWNSQNDNINVDGNLQMPDYMNLK